MKFTTAFNTLGVEKFFNNNLIPDYLYVNKRNELWQQTIRTFQKMS